MADPNLNSAERLEVYQGMFLINRSFSNIVRRLEELDKAEIFNSEELEQYRGLVQDLQVDINSHFLDALHEVELRDWAFFGKVRRERDKLLEG